MSILNRDLLPSAHVITADTTRGMAPEENKEPPHGNSSSPLFLEGATDYLLTLQEILLPLTPLDCKHASPRPLSRRSVTPGEHCVQDEGTETFHFF